MGARIERVGAATTDKTRLYTRADAATSTISIRPARFWWLSSGDAPSRWRREGAYGGIGGQKRAFQ